MKTEDKTQKTLQVILLIAFLTLLLSGCQKKTTSGVISPAGTGEQLSTPEVGNQEAENQLSTSEVGRSIRDDPLWDDPDALTAMIISDLHYTEYKEIDPLLVPGIAQAPGITDAIVDEVIARHPDVFIMTGDNTNSGYDRDVAGLLPKLQRIKDSGVPLIITTGNHDYDLMDAAAYEAAYFPLLDPVDRDPASLSYTAIMKDVVFLAMDDNATNQGVSGAFSPETMEWLDGVLSKYRSRPIIFLSHHNVLYGYGQEGSTSHLIQNPELPQLLREGGVKLALTGHMHYPYVSQQDGLWEILNGMPFSGRHLIGHLAVGKAGAGDDAAGKAAEGPSAADQDPAGEATDGSCRLLYYAEPIDFATYGGEVKDELDRLDRESAEYMDEVFSQLLEQKRIRGTKKKKVLELIDRFFDYFYAGTLADHAQEIREDPSYERMIKALWDYNYGPWMQLTVETTRYSARELEITSSLPQR